MEKRFTLPSGVSFTQKEHSVMLDMRMKIPELHDKSKYPDEWWRRMFDEEKKRKLSDENGLDEKIANGITRYGGTVSAEGVRADCTHIMYAQTKAQVFNIIESQFDEGTRQEAVKRSIENVLSAVSDNIDVYLRRSLIEGLKISE